MVCLFRVCVEVNSVFVFLMLLAFIFAFCIFCDKNECDYFSVHSNLNTFNFEWFSFLIVFWHSLIVNFMSVYGIFVSLKVVFFVNATYSNVNIFSHESVVEHNNIARILAFLCIIIKHVAITLCRVILTIINICCELHKCI